MHAGVGETLVEAAPKLQAMFLVLGTHGMAMMSFGGMGSVR